MTGWLIVNGFLYSDKFDELTSMFCEAAANQHIRLIVKQNSQILTDTATSLDTLPDFAIFWDKDILLGKYLEHSGVRLYNTASSIEICDDKRRTHLALMEAGVPTPRTIFAPMTYSGIGFTSYDFLEDIEDRLSYPMIVKEAYGSFGEQVYLANDVHELHTLTKNTHTTDLLFQEYISYSRGRDIRLQVVGSSVVAAMYRYSDNDFRANITAGGHMKSYDPSDEECDLAIRATHAVGATFAGVDILFGEDGPVVCEVNSNAHFKNLMDCTGVNVAEHILRYIEGCDDQCMVNI